MNSHTPIEDPALGLDRTLSSWPVLFNNNPLRQDVFVEGMKILLRGAYHYVLSLVSNYMGIQPASGIPTSEELVNLYLQSDHNQQTLSSDLEPPVTTTEDTLNNHSPSSTAEACGAETAGQPASYGGNSSTRALFTSCRRVKMWIAILIVGVMSLIVVPGTVISFFASFYYRLDK